MNPNKVIRPWIIAGGKQFGIRYGYEYRRPDDDTKQEEKYFVYRLMSIVPDQDGIHSQNTKTGTTANFSARKSHINAFEIDLYNSEDGARELCALCVMAQHDQEIRDLFKNVGGCSFLSNEGVENLTTWDNEIIEYHYRLTCLFYEGIEYNISKDNEVVESITFSMTWDGAE
jgi:hypothetical protein